ncbi:MAG: DUF2157 domain-containing protein [Opitutus sp.]
MSKPTRWLLAEIDRWTKGGLISSEQATQLRALYPVEETKSWGLLIFSGLGAAVIGLGVILLLAYNWAEIPKAGKLGLVLGSIIAAHTVGLWLRWKARDPQRDVGEALSVLGTMLFGAGIWLVAQVYHIDEHFPNGFLVWGAGALVLAWALQSVPQAVIATVTLSIWSSAELFKYDVPANWAPILILVGIAPLAWQRRSAVLMAVVLASTYLIVGGNAGYWNGGGGSFTALLSLSALLIALARLNAGAQSLGGISAVMTFFGWSGFLICSYVLSFKEAVRHLLRWSNDHAPAAIVLWSYRWPLFAAALVAWGFVVYRKWIARRAKVSTEEWLCPIALVYCQGLAVVGSYRDPQFIAIVFNFVILGISIMWMMRGCRDGALRSTVLGSLVFASLVFARYFDLFESLAIRGLVFLVVGGVLFAEGFFYRRLRHVSDEGRIQS